MGLSVHCNVSSLINDSTYNTNIGGPYKNFRSRQEFAVVLTIPLDMMSLSFDMYRRPSALTTPCLTIKTVPEILLNNCVKHWLILIIFGE